MKKENNFVLYFVIIVIGFLLYFPYNEIYRQKMEYKKLQQKYKQLQSILNRPVGSNEYKSAEETIKDLRAYIEESEKQLEEKSNVKTTKNGIKYKVLN